MAPSPHQFREIVFQLLYAYDFSGLSTEELIPLLMEEHSVTKKHLYLASEQLQKIREKQEEIDLMIGKTALSYQFERIPRVERNILRLGVYELLYDNSIPPKVAIAEAIRLCRKFATPEGATFVNGVLDALYKNDELPTKPALI